MHMQEELFKNTPNLNVIEGSVDNILLDNNNQCRGVILGSMIQCIFNYLNIHFKKKSIIIIF